MAKKASTKKYAEFESESYFDKVGSQVESNQSKLTMVLGGLIILVVVILLFNYFNRSKPSVGPSQQTQQMEDDVSPQDLPGKYTVKEGDTLFTIAAKYYNDGYKYSEIAQENNLTNPDSIEVGQQLEIPKLAEAALVTEETPDVSETEQPTPSSVTEILPSPQPSEQQVQTVSMIDWGSKITTDAYTVVEGDWLSTIAARAYDGDLLAYTKLAQANNIQNPDVIYPGQILTIPR